MNAMLVAEFAKILNNNILSVQCKGQVLEI